MKTALLVIDMQNDYLWEKRKPLFAYHTAELVSGVNAVIHEHADRGEDVIYIRHIIQNLVTNRLLFGYSIAGTQGAEIFSGIDIVSEYVFDKLVGDALTNKKLLSLLREKQIDTLHLCGLDEYGCVTATALGAVRRGFTAAIMQRGTETVLPERKTAKKRAKLEQAGVTRI